MNREILTEAVQQFLKDNAETNAEKLALSKSPFEKISSSELALQIESRQKAKSKLPLWYFTDLIYYPPSVSIEQASSEKTAIYKATLIKDGESLIDLTGGFGVDVFYFSRKAKKVVHCEINSELSEIVKYNTSQLGAQNIQFFQGNGIDFLLNNDNQNDSLTETLYDTVFIDPSRRVNTRKVFKLDDCEPNIIEWQQDIFKKSSRIIIKTSPLLDISLSLSQLKNVKEVHVISIKNECKELLFILEKGYIGEIQIHAILLNDHELRFSFLADQEKNTPLLLGEPMNYLYDPDSALLKAGCFKLIAERFNLKKLHLNTHLYSSESKVQYFPGRVFRIEEILNYKDFKKIKTALSANVITKNFPLNVEAIRKKHKIGESKNKFMFFCKTSDETLKVILAEREEPDSK